MYRNCPKCNAALDPDDAGSRLRCPSCGLVFAKYLQAQQGVPPRAPARRAALADDEMPGWRARLLYVPDRVDRSVFYGRCAAFVFCFVWGWRLYAMDVGSGEMGGSFMHDVLLPIHEAGHVLFMPFGRFLTVLGGSALQVLLPLVLAASFVYGFGGSRRDNFAAALMLWWAAMAVIDVAPYIWDAFDPKLMLLGGRTGAESDGHDWQNLLGDLGLIRRAHLIAGIAHTCGLALMLLADAWAAVLLYRQYPRRGDASADEG